MLKEISSLRNLIEKSKKEIVLIYKHSLTCNCARASRKELEKYKGDIFEMAVQTNRPLSNEIAKKLNISHESPQIIAIKNGKPIFVLDHQEINNENIKKLLK